MSPNRERQRAYERSEKGRERNLRKHEKSRQEGRMQARRAVRTAIERGELARTGVCQSGAREHRGPVHMHHRNGYDRAHWLDVEELCVLCHNRLEQLLRAKAAA